MEARGFGRKGSKYWMEEKFGDKGPKPLKLKSLGTKIIIYPYYY